VVEKLKRIKRFDPVVFPWTRARKTLYADFFRIQVAAGINLHCDGEHKHTDACVMYGFHDFRRAFATFNELQDMPASFVQSQMGHSTYQTTAGYVKFSERQRSYVDRLYLPPSLAAPVAQAGVQ
jgi:integrase